MIEDHIEQGLLGKLTVKRLGALEATVFKELVGWSASLAEGKVRTSIRT